MNLYELLNENKREKIRKETGVIIENRDYNRKDCEKVYYEIYNFIMNHSTKHGIIDRLYEEYYDVFKIMNIV